VIYRYEKEFEQVQDVFELQVGLTLDFGIPPCDALSRLQKTNDDVSSSETSTTHSHTISSHRRLSSPLP
jgi:hypothetical protein